VLQSNRVTSLSSWIAHFGFGRLAEIGRSRLVKFSNEAGSCGTQTRSPSCLGCFWAYRLKDTVGGILEKKIAPP
jgi:hypothetical protein